MQQAPSPAKLKLLDTVLAGLMRRYCDRVPAVRLITSSMVSSGMIEHESEIENDHIAFRTLGTQHLGISCLEKIFVSLGYTRRDPYFFAGKKLDAFWYSPPQDHYPRIFISELRVQDLSKRAQEIIKHYTSSVTSDPVAALDLNNGEAIDNFLHRPLWALPTWQEYQELLTESEYAAWTIYNRYYLNHFTISVHNLPAPYDSIELFNAFLEKLGVRLNDAGGKIKKSPDGLLLQSSTVAEMIEGEFRGDTSLEKHRISGSYVEFAERRALPQFANLAKDKLAREHRRDGFEAQNADKIFESTYSTQTGKQS